MGTKEPRMALEGLKALHRSMLSCDARHARFDFKYGRTEFAVLFCADAEPHSLLFVTKGANPRELRLEVEKGYRINIFLDEKRYQLLCEMLGFNISGKHGFSTERFFRALNGCIPARYSAANRVAVGEIASQARIVDEESKTYFMGWKRNSVGFPSRENLAKTLENIGLESYLAAKALRLSSRWTDIGEQAKDVHYGDGELF